MKAILVGMFLALPTFISRPFYNLARRWIFKDERDVTWGKVFDHVTASRVKGDYLEFGVFRGTSFVSAFKHARERRVTDMRFFAYDSFAGLPNDEGSVFKAGEYAISEGLFRRMIEKAGVDLRSCEIVPGFYEASLTAEHKRSTKLTSAAVIHIDCDLYTSTREVLRFVENLIGPGSVIVFDDWYTFGGNPEDHGEAKAFVEWVLHDRFRPFFDGKEVGKAAAKAYVMTH